LQLGTLTEGERFAPLHVCLETDSVDACFVDALDKGIISSQLEIEVTIMLDKSIGCNRIGEFMAGFSQVLQKPTKLVSAAIEIREQRVEDPANESFIRGFSSIVEALSKSMTVTKVKLDRIGIGDICAKKLGKCLPRMTNISTICFPNNCISVEGLSAIASGLAKNNSICELVGWEDADDNLMELAAQAQMAKIRFYLYRNRRRCKALLPVNAIPRALWPHIFARLNKEQKVGAGSLNRPPYIDEVTILSAKHYLLCERPDLVPPGNLKRKRAAFMNR
jgi:hypothetical protein